MSSRVMYTLTYLLENKNTLKARTANHQPSRIYSGSLDGSETGSDGFLSVQTNSSGQSLEHTSPTQGACYSSVPPTHFRHSVLPLVLQTSTTHTECSSPYHHCNLLRHMWLKLNAGRTHAAGKYRNSNRKWLNNCCLNLFPIPAQTWNELNLKDTLSLNGIDYAV